jgi:hypothetical protein
MDTSGRERTERCLAAILAADIAGYSRLIGRMKLRPSVQYLLIATLALVAVAFAIPAMRDSNLERWLRGECELLPGVGGRFAIFNCPQQRPYVPFMPWLASPAR